MAADLLPCAWCGAAAMTERPHPGCSMVYCSNIDCPVHAGTGWCDESEEAAHVRWNRRAPPLAAPAPSAMATGEARVYGPTAEDRAKLRDTPAVVPATTGEAPVCATCNDTHKMALGERMAPCTACPVPCFNCRERDTAYCATPRCACPCHGTQSHATTPAAPAAVTEERLRACGWDRPVLGFNDRFKLWDDGDPHGKVYLVCPGGTMVGFGSCEGDIDEQRVRFIMDACNAALAAAASAAPEAKP